MPHIIIRDRDGTGSRSTAVDATGDTKVKVIVTPGQVEVLTGTDVENHTDSE